VKFAAHICDKLAADTFLCMDVHKTPCHHIVGEVWNFLMDFLCVTSLGNNKSICVHTYPSYKTGQTLF